VRRFLRIVAIGLLSVAFLASCSDDDTTASTVTTLDDPTTSTGALTDGPQQVDLVATEYTYAGAPDELDAGPVRVTLTNRGGEEHQATFIRLNDGLSVRNLQQAQDLIQAFALFKGFGGPNSVGPAQAATTTQILDPGNYAVLCLLPASDGQPHAQKGMFAELEVGGEVAAGAALDATKAPITLQDFAFGVPADFDGQGSYRVVNEGAQAHELAIYQVADGRTFAEVKAYFDGGSSGAAPATHVGAGMAALHPGRDASLELALAPGTYVFVCFLPDTAESNGDSHVTRGMLQEVVVSQE
jgi:hypothetical protein